MIIVYSHNTVPFHCDGKVCSVLVFDVCSSVLIIQGLTHAVLRALDVFDGIEQVS